MKRKIVARRFWVAAGLSMLMLMPSVPAFARDRDDRGKGDDHRRREVVVVGHDRYHYRDGRFYRPGWFGLEFSIGTPPFGAVVTRLPFGYRTIVVADAPYYYYDNVYYRPCPGGYAVVPQPVVVAAPAPVEVQPQAGYGQTITINVPNGSGGFTPVTLVRQGNGYVGPQGEYYPGNPSVDQLRALYGK